MPEILLAANLIEPISPSGLGHLQLVHLADDGTQLEIEVQAPINVTFGNWTFPPVRDHTLTGSTSNYGVAGQYNAVELNLGDRLVEDVWALLVAVHEQFSSSGTEIEYDVYQNSNSYASTLLDIIGLNFENYFSAVRPPDVSSFPGAGLNVLNEKNTTFGLNLGGSENVDTINTGLGEDRISGGAGLDQLSSGGGDDILVGGSLADQPIDEKAALGAFDLANLDMRTNHTTWNDMSQDVLRGGSGADVYLISHENNYSYSGTIADALGQIDIIDEASGDGQGVILVQNHKVYGVPGGGTEEQYLSIETRGSYDVSHSDENGTYYTNTTWSNSQSETDWVARILVSNILDENGQPYIFLLPEYPDAGAPYAAIKGFRQGDFGIVIYNFIGPKEGSSGDDRILNLQSGDLRQLSLEDLNDVTLSSDPASDQRIHAGAGNDIAYGRGGADEIRGDEGNDQLFGNEGNDRISGGDGNDILEGNEDDDTLIGNFGDDDLIGGIGSDTYIYQRGDGNDNIAGEGDFTGENDVLDLTDLKEYEVSLGIVGNDLVVSVASTGEAITVGGHFVSQTSSNGIELIAFASGSVWDKAAIDARIADPLINGTTSDDVLQGTSGNNVLHGGGGTDHLLGGTGSDVYLYEIGDGNDNIDDQTSLTCDVDILRLIGLKAADVTLGRIGNDLNVTIAESGEVLTVSGQFLTSPDKVGLEEIRFSDGTFVDRATILAIPEITDDGPPIIAGTMGNDTLTGTSGDDVFNGGLGNDRLYGAEGSDVYIYASGDGSDYIDDEATEANSVDSLKFTDINAADISVTRDGVNLRITINATGDTITIDEQWYNSAGYWGFEKIDFADGSSWDRSTIMAIGTAPVGPITGTAGNDTLTGTSGADIFIGGLGDDRMLSGQGADVYIYTSGDGTDYIDDEANDSGSIDTLRFTDVNASDISAVRNGVNLDITVLSTGDVITIDEQWYDRNGYWGIEKIEFANGNSWDRQDIMTIGMDTFTITGTAGNDTLTGTSDADVFNGGLGDDYLLGGLGADTYIYARGDGTDYIDDEASEPGAVDTLQLTDLNASDIAASRSGINLKITVLDTGDVITIDEQWYNPSAYWGFEKITFADGTSWDRSVLMSVTANAGLLVGTTASDTLTGTTGNDIIAGLNGNDSIFGGAGDDRISGGVGDDLLNPGIGNDTVDGGAGSDTITFEGRKTNFTISVINSTSVRVEGDGISTLISNGEWIVFDAPDGETDESIDVLNFINQNRNSHGVRDNSVEMPGSFEQPTGVTEHENSRSPVELASADIIAFPALTSLNDDLGGDLGSFDGIGNQSEDGTSSASADIISLEEFVAGLQSENHGSDLWFEPEPIGALI